MRQERVARESGDGLSFEMTEPATGVRLPHVLILTLAAVGLAAAQPARPAVDTANPFANVETLILANGLKVWFKRLPGQRTVSATVMLPYGSGEDPIGKEQL